MTDTHAIIQNLIEANPLREPVLRSVIQALHLPVGSRGLDAGCGIGLQALLLADAVGAEGQITGMDIAPELLAHGEKLVEKAGFSGRITFQQGDINRLPFDDRSFDWAWSADCIGYPLGEWTAPLEELKHVVRPGGFIYILAWTSQQIIPGYPILEARLIATNSAYLPYLNGKDPQLNFLRAGRWFQKAGLEDIRAQTYAGDFQAPLAEGQRRALISLFEMLWGQPQPEVSPEDWQEFQRLCRPGSPDFILDIPEYYAFFTYTLFRGKVPAFPGIK